MHCYGKQDSNNGAGDYLEGKNEFRRVSKTNSFRGIHVTRPRLGALAKREQRIKPPKARARLCVVAHMYKLPASRGHRSDDVGAGHCETLPLSHIAPGHAPREHLIRAHCNFSGQLIIVKT